MRFRPPSLGFLYLLTTGLVTSWTISFILQPMFFERPWGSPEKDLGEARYIARIAVDATENQQKQWLPRALVLALNHADVGLANEILGLLDRSGVSEGAAGLIEIYPEIVWGFGMTEDGWTLGSKRGGLLIKNPDTEPHKLVLTFTDGGVSDKRRGSMECFMGKTRTNLTLKGKAGEEKLAQIETPLVPGNSVLVVNFRAYYGKVHEGRDLGVRLVGVEIAK